MTDEDLERIAKENEARKVAVALAREGRPLLLRVRHGHEQMEVRLEGEEHVAIEQLGTSEPVPRLRLEGIAIEALRHVQSDDAPTVIDTLLSEIATMRLLVADLSQDGRNVEAYQQGIEEGKRRAREGTIVYSATRDCFVLEVEGAGSEP